MTPTPVVVMVPAGRRSPALVFIGLLFLAGASWLGFFKHWDGPAPAGRVEIPCTIDRFEIRDDAHSPQPFHADLTYGYRWQDRDHTGTRLWPEGNDSVLIEPLNVARRELSHGAEGEMASLSGAAATCWIDPLLPDNAFLLPHATLFSDRSFVAGVAALLLGWIGLLAVLNGLRKGGGLGLGGPFVALFFCFFAVPSVIMTKFNVLGEQGLLSRLSWRTAPATVLWSRQDGTGQGATARIYYEYRWNNVAHRASAISAMQDSLRGAPAAPFVAEHPAGSTLTVHVNPRRPELAVIDNSLPVSLFMSGFSLPFLVVGLGGVVFALRRPPALLPSDPVRPGGPFLIAGQPLRLRGASLGQACFLTVLSLYLSMMLFTGGFAFNGGGSPSLLFFPIFGVVLAGLGYLSWNAWRAHFGPSWELSLSRTPLGPGDPATVHWRLIPGRWQPKSFSVLVQVQYETRHRGTKGGVRYAYPELAAVEVMEKTLDPAVMAGGEAEFQLPENLYAALPDPKTPLRGQLKIIYCGSGKKIFEQTGIFRLVPPV